MHTVFYSHALEEHALCINVVRDPDEIQLALKVDNFKWPLIYLSNALILSVVFNSMKLP